MVNGTIYMCNLTHALLVLLEYLLFPALVSPSLAKQAPNELPSKV